jgi:hypothetical protein
MRLTMSLKESYTKMMGMFRRLHAQVFFYSVALFLAPQYVFGDTGGVTPDPNCPQGKICNPLQFDSLTEFIKAVVEIIAFIGIPIAVVFIMYAGLLFVTARGDEAQLTKAKKALMWALIGTAVLLGAWVISNAIAGTVNQLKA